MDPSKLTDQLGRLADRMEHDPSRPFSDAEIARLREGLLFVERVKVLGWWGKWALYGLGIAAVVLSQWQGIRNTLGGGP